MSVMTAPMPAEPADAGSTTPKTEPPLWVDDYDLSDQPLQAATEPPEPPAEAEPEQLSVAPTAAKTTAAPTAKKSTKK